MSVLFRAFRATLPLALLAAATPALAHGIDSPAGGADPAYDIVQTQIRKDGGNVVFSMRVSGKAGAVKPTPTGKLAGSDIYSYVWPTSLDSAAVGFEPGQGILAFAVTSHADFDDTPAYDENGDGDPKNDGDVWHSHWVVLVPDDACGPGALKIKDIPEGTKPKLPETWPGLPILIDSPDYSPVFEGATVQVAIPAADLETPPGTSFDGVTAGLRVNQSVHAPLVCVADVWDIGSGDLSLPGKVM